MQTNDPQKHRYDDIIDLPHHQSMAHPQMSRINRAAQFAPFAALTGYDAAIAETGRLTDAAAELDESRKAVLNAKLQLLLRQIHDRPPATFTFFVPDQRKAGGAYRSVTGIIRKYIAAENALLLEDGTVIPIDRITDADSPLLLRAAKD